jgi:trimethylamine---corrinoid protein Co-methyltransferase
MYAAGHAYNLMSTAEVETIHRSALRILDEVGMEIQNERLLKALADFGLRVDFAAQRVRFPPALVERFLAEAEHYDWDKAVPQVGGSAGVYHSLYHDPHTGQLVAWTEERLAFYFALAKHLDHLSGASMLGSRLPCPPPLEPLYERYYCWKYGAREGSSIYLDELCPFLLELYQAAAQVQGKPVGEIFRGTVYLVPPLKLGVHEAYQVAYFWEHGLRVGIGDMYAMGASAPVTLAGAVTLNLAEQLALRMLDWALWGRKTLALGGSISVMDMRTTIYPYGRPEMAIANLMTAQLARHYRAYYSGHAGLSDAKLPSVEAGYQKALTAIPTLLACGSFWMDAGLLSIDEVCSPVQLILDNEFLGALERFTRQSQISEESIGLETILEVGPGGHFLDKRHTVAYLRQEQWQPALWSRQMLRPWMEAGDGLDADRARQVALDFERKSLPPAGMSPELESEVLRLIEKARGILDC